MQSFAIAILVLFPLAASADHLDVIRIELNEDCKLGEFVAIAKEFNEQWANNYDYRAEVAVPIQSEELVSVFWLGRSSNTEGFGKAWDAWRSQIGDSKSVAGRLQKRFDDCSVNLQRSGYDVY